MVVLGEVKSHQPIDENDIENLTWAQGLFRRQRIECFILVGTLQQAMSDGEIQILRRYCECAPRLLHDEGSAVGVTLPIVLTQRQLSVERFAEDHPFKWSEPGRGLTSVAFASCKNNLGLHEIGIAYGGDDWTQQLQWTSEAGAPTADGE